MNTHVVIMAGGVGSRLWPASTRQMPKQFLDMLGIGESLIQLTVKRFLPVCQPDRFWVVTSSDYVDIVREQLPMIPQEQILAEPVARNTAPCIAYACWKIASKYPDANIVVTPADALVINTERFSDAISMALSRTEATPDIVTVGIAPSRPETGYGYICAENTSQNEIVKVNAFKEKPDYATALKYIEEGNYFWNAGIFVWNVKTIKAAIKEYAPQIAGIMEKILPSFYTEAETAAIEEHFPQCEKISIDYAVMEKSPDIYVIASDLGWSDLGSWASVHSHSTSDEKGNSVVGDGISLFDCNNCQINASGLKSLVVQGLDGYVVAAKDGRVLICKLSEDQRIKEFSAGKL